MKTIAMLLLLCGSARAEDRAAAKAHYNEGMKYYNLGNFTKAREEFQAAYLKYPEPVFLYDIGQCSRMLGDHEDSIRSYRAFLREQSGTPMRADIERFIAEAQEAIRKRAVPTAPTGTVAPGELRPAAPEPHPAPEPSVAEVTTTDTAPSPPKRKWLWVGLGAGAAVLVGVVVGVAVAMSGGKDAPVPMTTLGGNAVNF